MGKKASECFIFIFLVHSSNNYSIEPPGKPSYFLDFCFPSLLIPMSRGMYHAALWRKDCSEDLHPLTWSGDDQRTSQSEAWTKLSSLLNGWVKDKIFGLHNRVLPRSHVGALLHQQIWTNLLSLTPKQEVLETSAQADISQPMFKHSLAASLQHFTWTNALGQVLTALDASPH